VDEREYVAIGCNLIDVANNFVFWKGGQHVGEVIEFVLQAGSADLCYFCNLCPEGFWPFVNVVVVGLEDVGRCFQQFRKVEGDPDVNEVRRGRVFSGRAKEKL